MATLEKNFRIKNGLVVEGTTATINGNTILAQNTADTYILNLVGGATLVKSVDTIVFHVDGSGKLTINSNTFDAYGAASSAQSAAESYTDSAISTEVSNRNSAIATAKSQAESYTDSSISTEVSNRNSAITSAINSATSTIETAAQGYATTAQNNAESYTDGKISAEVTRANAAYDPAGSASTAQSNAESYTDSKIATEVSNRNSAITSAINTATTSIETAAQGYATTAQTNAEGYTDTKIAALVGSAPSLLSTLQEIDAAINNDANFSTTLLSDIATAKAQSESYTDAAIATEVSNRNTAISSQASTTLSSAESYTDSKISSGNSSATPTYQALNVNSVSKIEATTVSVPTAGSATALSWAVASYGSAELIVKFRTGTDTTVMKLLVTVDSSNNVAETQWAQIDTNAGLGTVACSYAGGNVNVIVTTNQASTTVNTHATLIA